MKGAFAHVTLQIYDTRSEFGDMGEPVAHSN
jgi:hypothetical protein